MAKIYIGANWTSLRPLQLKNDHYYSIIVTMYYSSQWATTPTNFFCYLQIDIFDAPSLFWTNHVVHWNAPCEGIFLVWHHDFFILRDVHSQEESLPLFLSAIELSAWPLFISWKYDQDKFGAGFLDAQLPVSFPLEDKHVVNEHHVVRKSHDATQKKCPHVVHFNVQYHVIGLNQSCSIKNVTLKAATCKKIMGVAVYWEE